MRKFVFAACRFIAGTLLGVVVTVLLGGVPIWLIGLISLVFGVVGIFGDRAWRWLTLEDHPKRLIWAKRAFIVVLIIAVGRAWPLAIEWLGNPDTVESELYDVVLLCSEQKPILNGRVWVSWVGCDLAPGWKPIGFADGVKRIYLRLADNKTGEFSEFTLGAGEWKQYEIDDQVYTFRMIHFPRTSSDSTIISASAVD